MYEVSSIDEIKRAISSNRVVIIEYYDPDSRESREFSKAVKAMEHTLDPSILLLRVSIKKFPSLIDGIKEIPCIRVYLDGRLVFEQRGSFGNRDLDLIVLRRSIRSTLRNLNATFKI